MPVKHQSTQLHDHMMQQQSVHHASWHCKQIICKKNNPTSSDGSKSVGGRKRDSVAQVRIINLLHKVWHCKLKIMVKDFECFDQSFFSVSFIFRAINKRNSGKSIVPLPSASTSLREAREGTVGRKCVGRALGSCKCLRRCGLCVLWIAPLVGLRRVQRRTLTDSMNAFEPIAEPSSQFLLTHKDIVSRPQWH